MEQAMYEIRYQYKIRKADGSYREGFDYAPCYDLKDYNETFWSIVNEGSIIIAILFRTDEGVKFVYEREVI